MCLQFDLSNQHCTLVICIPFLGIIRCCFRLSSAGSANDVQNHRNEKTSSVITQRERTLHLALFHHFKRTENDLTDVKFSVMESVVGMKRFLHFCFILTDKY
jgi:hypothetical protein